MEFIVFISGRVRYPITIDPTVWIFDERKVDLTTYFDQDNSEEAELERYTKAISKQWDKEITEGSQAPKKNPTNEVRSKKEQLIHGTFGIPFRPFIENAEPEDGAEKVVIQTSEGAEHIVALEQAKRFIIGFSYDGQPLRETGPIHVYNGDGSDRENPIRFVTGFKLA
ncbi:peptidyl-prolyl cis-trans isomerase [Alteribacillus sp. HJP-4]|uniref:peptidyl-prolyl cis-trans isomerase n=1 Tax=Alteribacillus sp. HJP-4 TaxID=2775394 RepID=UPI0035CCDCB9